MSSSESSDTEMIDRKRKKGCPETWKRNERKKARLLGSQYTTKTGKIVSKREVKADCTCKNKCMTKFTMEEKEAVLRALYEKGSKNQQDVYLHGLMECKPVVRKRPNKEAREKLRTASFSYYIRKPLEKQRVCKTAFLNLHSISNSRLQRLNRLFVSQSSPRDLRGTHNNRPHTLQPQVTSKIHHHIESFPRRTSHYSSKEIHYLDSNLNVKTMYNLFVKLHPELTKIVEYEFYLKFFKENFALKFGRPQVDVCGQCEELTTKLKDSNLNDNAKRVAAAELMVHKRRAKKFYSKLKEVTDLCHEREDVGGIVFDYVQNMPLPVIPVQEIFYYRQLWLYGFEIHDLKNDTGHFYTYHEGQAAKGPNEAFFTRMANSYEKEQERLLHLFEEVPTPSASEVEDDDQSLQGDNLETLEYDTRMSKITLPYKQQHGCLALLEKMVRDGRNILD
ncbi:unnamed protein product [Acanthoscelides obtectus]|uniref:Uncharacterized protein n=1 Tax=Acanthoscelides obtectus TaxID=200917 RepID=A0A9P0LBZ1_ACAOB|nr:unnamed protein product [Acanthoscelides obtectus]CAK1620403.1 hypothetical protein AOBTE_LOCUS363 [Acanthoscelides obtectus]